MFDQSDPFPSYDELHVISDLHLGGYDGKDSSGRPRSYRIFRDSKALAWFIGERSRVSTPRTALVLNGDIVDFLADEDPVYFDDENAERRLLRIIEDKQQAEVWSALRTYVKDGKGDLVVTLGNHDVEL